MSLNNWLPAVSPPAIWSPPHTHTKSVIPKNPFGLREIGRFPPKCPSPGQGRMRCAWSLRIEFCLLVVCGKGKVQARRVWNLARCDSFLERRKKLVAHSSLPAGLLNLGPALPSSLKRVLAGILFLEPAIGARGAQRPKATS